MPRMLRSAIIAIVMAGLSLVASPLSAAEGKLVTVEKFTKGNAELAVAHFTDPDVERSKSRVGLIGIASPDRNSFAFDPAEWQQLMALCTKAIGTKAAGWTVVGTMTESGTEDVSQLTVSAGPGLSLVIASPKSGTVTYVLDKGELARFQKGLRQVKDYLAK
jgi:hypothetical protein